MASPGTLGYTKMKHTENFTGFEIRDGFAIINTSLKEFFNKQDYPYAVFIEIIFTNYRSENQLGMPTASEAEYLDEIEENLVLHFERHIKSVYIGHTSLMLKREIIFYIQDPDLADSFLREWIKSTKRETDYEIYDDPLWEKVNYFLGHLKE